MADKAEPMCFTKDDEEEAELGEVRHHCTDPVCFLLFVAALAGLGMVLNYAQEHGDVRRITHGYNYKGDLCGVDAGVVSKPYLFWCRDPNTQSLDFDHPICRETCPVNSNTHYSCYFESQKTGQQPIPMVAGSTIDQANSFQVQRSIEFRFKSDYPTRDLFGRYCVPDPTAEPTMYKALQAHLQQVPGYSVFMKAASVKHAWPLLLISAAIALALGFIYLCLLRSLAKCLIWTSLVVLVLACFGAGGTVIYQAQTGNGLDGMPSTGDSNWDTVVGGALIAVGVVAAFLACCAAEAVNKACDVIEMACDCVWDLPSLLYEPLITFIIKFGSFCGLLYGFMWLLSCGQMSQMSDLEYASVYDSSATIPKGVVKTFTYSDGEKRMILLYIFMIYWSMEFFTALGQYVLSFCVGKWFYTPKDEDGHKHPDSCLLLWGYGTAVLHVGTIAYGSFIIATCRFVRAVLAFLARQAGKDGNTLVKCLLECCMCLITCFQKTMEYINKNAYVDVAIFSNNFCTAAWRAFTFITEAGPTILVLNAACCVFMYAGIGCITSVCSYAIYLTTRSLPMFTEASSAQYVSDPLGVTLACGIVAFVVSYGFMSLFDTVADALLYCYARAVRREGSGVKDYTHDSLHNLCQGDPHE